MPHPDEARGLLADIVARGALWIIEKLGYTPANKAGDTFTGNLNVLNARLEVNTNSGVGAVVRIDYDVTNATRRLHALETGGGNARPLRVQAQTFTYADDTAVRFSIDTSGNAGFGVAPSGSFKLRINGALQVSSTTLISSATTLTNGAAAAAGTLANAPVAGNPTKWIPIDDNGTTRYIPAW